MMEETFPAIIGPCMTDRVPDEILSLILALLSTEDLLSVRAACRRFRDLAAQPAVWRRRSVSDKLASVALKLAPCLDYVKLYLWKQTREGVGKVAVSTACKVRKLKMTIRNPKDNWACALDILRNLAPHVRHLYMNVHRAINICKRDRENFMRILAEDCRQLVELGLETAVFGRKMLLPLDEDEKYCIRRRSFIVRSTTVGLKRLNLELVSGGMEVMGECLMQHFGSTLEEVNLSRPEDLRTLSECPLPLLKTADVTVCAELAGVRTWSQLTSLTLWCRFEKEHYDVSERLNLTPFLEHLVHLQSLSFRGYPDISWKCLTRARMPSIECVAVSLCATSFLDDDFCLQDVLNSCPRLRLVRVGHEFAGERPDAKLKYNVDVAVGEPGLVIDMYGWGCGNVNPVGSTLDNEDGCKMQGLSHLVERNPSLHIIGLRIFQCDPHCNLKDVCCHCHTDESDQFLSKDPICGFFSHIDRDCSFCKMNEERVHWVYCGSNPYP